MNQITQSNTRLHFAFEFDKVQTLACQSGITPVAAANATRPEPAGNEMPIGKRSMTVATGTNGVRQQHAV